MAQEVLVLSLCEDIKSVKSRHDMRNTYLLCSPLYFRVEDGSSLLLSVLFQSSQAHCPWGLSCRLSFCFGMRFFFPVLYRSAMMLFQQTLWMLMEPGVQMGILHAAHISAVWQLPVVYIPASLHRYQYHFQQKCTMKIDCEKPSVAVLNNFQMYQRRQLSVAGIVQGDV